MTLHRFKMALASLVSISACLLRAAPAAMAEKGAFKLEGAWVGNLDGCPGQFSYVLTPDPSGRRAFGHGSVDVGFATEAVFGPAFGPTDSTSPVQLNAVMTGPDTAVFYAVWYGLRTLAAPSPITAEVVYIAVSTGEFKFVGPGKMMTTHNFAYYYPSQDADGDGFPDEGETTPYMFQKTSVDTRLPSPQLVE